MALLTKQDLIAALDVFVETDSEGASQLQYDRIQRVRRSDIEQAKDDIINFAKQMEDMSLEAMQDVYYEMTSQPKYSTNRYANSVIGSVLNARWNAIGPWVS